VQSWLEDRRSTQRVSWPDAITFNKDQPTQAAAKRRAMMNLEKHQAIDQTTPTFLLHRRLNGNNPEVVTVRYDRHKPRDGGDE